MRQRVPRLASVVTEIMPDGRLLLQIKDAPFDQPILSRFASDGTLKMLAYLTILYGPNPPPFIGIEEPENFLYPHLLPGLAEECRAAAEFAQILISTHSPTFVNWFRPEEVLVLSRDHQGYTRIARAADIRGVREFLDTGARLGDLWLEGYLTSP
jgi:Predicted ATPase